jgi:hypothetical protein
MSPHPDFPREPSSRPLVSKSFLGCLAIIPFAVFYLLASWGLDFGYHWDEKHNKINALAHTLEHNFTLLPDGYTYPGVNYWLCLAALTPDIVKTLRTAGPDAAAFKATLAPVVQSQAFLLRVRSVYVFVTALTAVWIFLAVLIWGGVWWEAMGSALIFATGWEAVYHGRWVAPDTILMQFGALTLLLLTIAWKKNSRLALNFAAAAAGLACGSKYPGALLLLPVLLMPWLQMKSVRDAGSVILRCGVLGLIFWGAYVATTPGTVIQPIAFYESLVASWKVYASGWFGYTVVPGGSHLAKMFVYFSTVVPSAFVPLAVTFFGLALLGVWPVVKESRRAAFLLLLFPLCYALYFSRQATMVVRNYLVLLPFLIFFIGRGIYWVHTRLPSPIMRLGFLGLIAGLIAVNLADQIRASHSVAQRHNAARFERELARYVHSRPNKNFAVSDRVKAVLAQQQVSPTTNWRLLKDFAGQPFDEYLSHYNDTVLTQQNEWPSNQPGMFAAVIGPREVNLNYYTGWQANDHVVSLSWPTVVRMRAAGLMPNP